MFLWEPFIKIVLLTVCPLLAVSFELLIKFSQIFAVKYLLLINYHSGDRFRAILALLLPFTLIDTFWCICICSRRCLKTLCQKEKFVKTSNLSCPFARLFSILFKWKTLWQKEKFQNEQFLLLSLCFQKAVCCRSLRKRFKKLSAAEASESVYVRERVNRCFQ